MLFLSILVDNEIYVKNSYARSEKYMQMHAFAYIFERFCEAKIFRGSEKAS